MANINIRVDDQLKHNAFAAFERLGLSPSEALRAFLEYVATTGKMPIKQVLMADEDNDLHSFILSMPTATSYRKDPVEIQQDMRNEW